MNWNVVPNEQVYMLRMVTLAMLLGACVGFDREQADQPAGLRTHVLVAGAAVFLVSLGNVRVTHFDMEMSNNALRSDPIRTIEAVVTGVAFLGGQHNYPQRRRQFSERFNDRGVVVICRRNWRLRGVSAVCDGARSDSVGATHVTRRAAY